MKRISTLRVASIFILMTFILAFSGEHPTGRTGAPGDSSCNVSCHTGSANFSGAINISGLPGTPIPGQTYTLSVDLSAAGAAMGGFSLVALDSNDSNAGNFSGPDGSSSIRMAGGREYWGHNPAQSLAGGSATWSVDWTAPNISDDVTFYVCGVAANGNGGNSGDETVFSDETITITAMTELDLDFVEVFDPTCFGGSDGLACVIVNNGVSPYLYQWSNGVDEFCIEGVTAGTYDVTVTDSQGSTGEGSITLQETPPIQDNAFVADITCFGNSDGVIELNPTGGGGTPECVWDFGMGCTQENLAAGIYMVTVQTRFQGGGVRCSEVFTYEIIEPIELEADISSTPADQGSNGTATAEGLGGTAPYNFQWSNGVSDNGVLESTITDLAPDIYLVTITDINDCEIIEEITVTGSACNLLLSTQVDNISCAGADDGVILLNVSGASGNETYLWSNGATTPDLSGLSAGTYDVTVSDGPACEESLENITITEPSALRSELVVRSNPSCPNIENGRLAITVDGGTMGYDLLWSNGASNDTTITGMDTIINLPDTLTFLSVGWYAFTLTDASGCELIDSVEMRNGDVLAPFVTLKDITVELDGNSTADAVTFADVDDGSFDNCGIGSVEFSAGPFDCNDVGTRRYDATVTDDNGNSTTETVRITVEEKIAPEIDCSLSSVESNSCDAITYVQPLATDNCGIDEITLVEGLQSGSSFPAGTNTVTYRATDESGNTADCSFTITVNNDLGADFLITDTSCGEENGQIEITPTGGTPPYDISPNLQGREDLRARDYTFLITDAEGCSYEETVTVMESNNDLEVNITTQDVLCNGDATGSVELDITGGSSPYLITFNFPNISPDNLPAGDYNVVIQDETGCTIDESFSIEEPSPIMVDYNATCDELPTLIISGGSGGYTIDTVMKASIVTYTVEDVNGCSTSQDIELLTSPDIELVEITDQTNFSNGSIDVNIEEEGISSIIWYTEWGEEISTEEDLTDAVAGTYIITITYDNGCISTASYDILLNTSIIEDLDNSILKLYPNPVSSMITIEYKDKADYKVKIYNTEGELLYKKNNIKEKASVDVQNFSSGIYLLRLSGDDGKEVVKRFLKQ